MASKLSGKNRTSVITNLGSGFTTAEFFGQPDNDDDGIFEIADLAGLQGKSLSDLLTQAGMLWTVEQADVQYEDATGVMRTVPRQFVNYRSDTGEAVGVVGQYYVPESPHPFLTFASDAVHLAGGSWMGAGSLQGGKTIVAAARLLDPIYIGGDPDEGVLPMLIAKTGNGGNLQRELYAPLMVRTICVNKNVWAVPAVESIWKGRHTAKSQTSAHLQSARETVGNAIATAEAFKAQTEGWLATKVDDKQVERFLRDLLPCPADAGKAKKTSVANRRDAVKAIFKNGADLQNITGTAYGLVQAVCQWQDWEARTKQHNGRSKAEVLFERSIQPNEYKDRAVSLVTKLAARS